ncbi:MAG: tRNA guanosine(34) transglycosylase Tgt [Parvibaculaceae bacterium]|nr:tRNA guanosine(34) transglycosylase Tgt [Parvibaculaceae bacterium]
MAQDGAARRGVIHTPRGDIQTPAFMPVGTAGTVKALYPEQVKETGADIVLGNTYHLMLRPGAEEIAALGGLHKFMNWSGPILTDSGGFQVMSLSKLRKMTEEGVSFQSHIDGRKFMLTPERSIEIQCLLGSDIQMVLDECTPFPATEEQTRVSMELSMRWAKRSKDAFVSQPHRLPGQALFGIVQGGVYQHLREQSAAGLQEIGFPGYSIGGLAVGEGQKAMLEVLDFTAPLLPKAKPRYLMGVGTPDDLVEAVSRGVDMFDCVMPTRSGRHGQIFTRYGKLNMKNAKHAKDERPIDPNGPCEASRDYSRAYLHHLMKSGEILGLMLLSWHNIAYYESLMAQMRDAISEGRFGAFYRQFKADQEAGEA